MAGPTPSRAHDNDCLCLPAASTSHQSEAGKKESPDHHLNPACQPCAEPSSISSFDCRLINARTADNGSAQNGSTNKSAKVVLGVIRVDSDTSVPCQLSGQFRKCRFPCLFGAPGRAFGDPESRALPKARQHLEPRIAVGWLHSGLLLRTYVPVEEPSTASKPDLLRPVIPPRMTILDEPERTRRNADELRLQRDRNLRFMSHLNH